jgi:hypothetical protein
MTKETKFGYGFLLAGIGLPYLIDKLLGPLAAIIAAGACLILGVVFLVSGHVHRDRDEPSRGRTATFLTFIVAVAILGLVCCGIFIGISKLTNSADRAAERIIPAAHDASSAEKAAVRISRPQKAKSSSQFKTKNKDDEMSFSEVPPSKLGLPEEFVIQAGGSTHIFPKERLAEQLPFGILIGIRTPEEIPLKIYFDSAEKLKVDALLYDASGVIAAKMVGNEFSVVKPGWDRNFDEHALEVIDESGRAMFRIERLARNVLSIKGRFVTPNGTTWSFSDNGTSIKQAGITDVPPLPEAVFRYPGNKFLHKRLKQKATKPNG